MRNQQTAASTDWVQCGKPCRSRAVDLARRELRQRETTLSACCSTWTTRRRVAHLPACNNSSPTRSYEMPFPSLRQTARSTGHAPFAPATNRRTCCGPATRVAGRWCFGRCASMATSRRAWTSTRRRRSATNGKPGPATSSRRGFSCCHSRRKRRLLRGVVFRRPHRRAWARRRAARHCGYRLAAGPSA